MERQNVESSMILSIGYDPNSATLEIEFINGGAVWQYYDVPEYVFNELMATSHGKYFHACIKNQYTGNRIG